MGSKFGRSLLFNNVWVSISSGQANVGSPTVSSGKLQPSDHLFLQALHKLLSHKANPCFIQPTLSNGGTNGNARETAFASCALRSSVQFSSVAQSCPTLCKPMKHSTPGLPVHHQLPEFTQTHVHRVREAIQPSHPQSSPFPPALNPSQHQSLSQWVNSSYEVAKVLEFQF